MELYHHAANKSQIIFEQFLRAKEMCAAFSKGPMGRENGSARKNPGIFFILYHLEWNRIA